jgi:DNA-binding NtrC family response regulator
MVNVRPQAGQDGGCPSQPGGRLNVLLSYAGWQPESWVDRLPPLLEPMGILSHRARSGRQAQRVIQDTRIHIAVVDLALPLDEESYQHEPAPEFQEGGPRLLELISRLESRPPVIAVKRARGTRDDCRDLAAALRLGAFAVVDRPREQSDLEVILGVLRRILERHYQGRWPVP